MLYRWLAIILLVTIFIGCSNDDDEQPDTIEEFVGTYYADDDSLITSSINYDTDSVILTIYNNQSYNLVFFPLNSSDNSKPYCNCEGTVDVFGSNFIAFYPTVVESSNCDDLRIPRGAFFADYASHGDTIYISKSVRLDTVNSIEVDTFENALFRFKLFK